MIEELNITMNINLKSKTLYIGEEDSSGAVYRYDNIDDLSKQIKFYLENYYTKEIEVDGELLKIADDVELIYDFLKEQSDTEWIDLEKLKVLQDKGFVVPGDRPTDLMNKLDKLLEKLWEGLEDIPFYEEDSELHIEEDYLDFEEGTSREDIWHWFDERHSKGVYFLLYEYGGIEKETIVCYTEISERIPEEKRDKDLFYYECRTCGEETTIEKNVRVDFSGTFITDKDILKDKEYIKLNELFNDSRYNLLDDSDIHERVEKYLDYELEEEEEQ